MKRRGRSASRRPVGRGMADTNRRASPTAIAAEAA
jgi:hypothetical protein